MSDKTITVPQLPFDAIINIEVSGGFVKRCQDLLLVIAEDMGEGVIQKSLDKFKNTTENPDSINEAALYILMALVSESEKCAIDQKKVTYVDINEEELKKAFS